ncbi:hypothetical protein GCM10008959_23360 [Deinococcus seoulensis]|uniref:TrbI/VirB10 family protein n=1 Tax=Deinococcus seoulensis TaxID=1837379 RepID=A0ABQ2RS70_9DEIO|nr:hypothetical protein [Deinococcus seoulensis]GGR60866.1 hypothetical protein GCM10008959_23360 [Deinococcus seoulensis]
MTTTLDRDAYRDAARQISEALGEPVPEADSPDLEPFLERMRLEHPIYAEMLDEARPEPPAPDPEEAVGTDDLNDLPLSSRARARQLRAQATERLWWRRSSFGKLVLNKQRGAVVLLTGTLLIFGVYTVAYFAKPVGRNAGLLEGKTGNGGKGGQGAVGETSGSNQPTDAQIMAATDLSSGAAGTALGKPPGSVPTSPAGTAAPPQSAPAAARTPPPSAFANVPAPPEEAPPVFSTPLPSGSAPMIIPDSSPVPTPIQPPASSVTLPTTPTPAEMGRPIVLSPESGSSFGQGSTGRASSGPVTGAASTGRTVQGSTLAGTSPPGSAGVNGGSRMAGAGAAPAGQVVYASGRRDTSAAAPSAASSVVYRTSRPVTPTPAQGQPTAVPGGTVSGEPSAAPTPAPADYFGGTPAVAGTVPVTEAQGVADPVGPAGGGVVYAGRGNASARPETNVIYTAKAQAGAPTTSAPGSGRDATLMTSSPSINDASAQEFATTGLHPVSAVPARLITVLEAPLGRPVPAVAESEAGIWVGTAQPNPETGRMDVLFDRLIQGGRTYQVQALAYDPAYQLGLSGAVQDRSPAFLQDVMRSALNGLNTYAQGLASAGRTTIQGGVAVQDRNAPPLAAVLAGQIGQLFQLPQGNQSVIRTMRIERDTPLLVMLGVSTPRN